MEQEHKTIMTRLCFLLINITSNTHDHSLDVRTTKGHKLNEIQEPTLLFNGEIGTSTSNEKPLGKIPFSTSLTSAFIIGKHTATASLKSLSSLLSFFLQWIRLAAYLQCCPEFKFCKLLQKGKHTPV